MKFIAAILIAALASCATPPPRAIIPPPSEIKELDTKPVSKAATQTRTAVRDIAKAGQETRKASLKLADTSILLRASIDRAELLSEANEELRAAFAEIQRFALQLSADLDHLKKSLHLAEEKETIAISTVDQLTSEVSTLSAANAAQKVQINQALAAEHTLRKQVEALAAASDDLAIAKDKLEWWRWAGAITWILIALYIAARILLRTAIPFRF